MRNESITIIESSTHSSHIKGATASKKEDYHRSLVVTPSPPKQKSSSMGSSPTRSLSPSIFEVSSSKSSSSGSGDLLHLSKDDDRLLDTDDDTASSYEEEEEDDNTTDLDYDDSDEDSLIDPAHNFNYYIVDNTTNNITDEKQLFFPPNYHHPPTTTNQKHNTNNNNTRQENNPSIPSYFLCPITHQIMIDPVIDLEGNTYERHAIIRWLVLYQNTSPITGNALMLEELKVDKLVKVAIEKARRDAWVRYILELEVGEDVDGDVDVGDEKKNKKGDVEMTNGIKEGKPTKRTSSEPKQKENTMKSDLESYLDRKNATGSTSRSGSKHSAASGSKHSGSKHSGGSSSSQGKRKKEVVSASAAVAGGSLPPSSSKKLLQQQQQQQQQNLRPKTPPPSKILLPNEKRNASIKSTKSSKSNSSSGGSVPKEKKPQAQQRRASDTPPTNPISSITVPKKTTTSTAATSPPLVSSNTSITSAISFGIEKLHNGWTVPLGVHKIICSSPGLLVSTTVHRRSTPVKRTVRDINNNFVKKDLIIAPGSYVEILETQVHGGRVRGRIVWEEEDLECSEGGSSGKKLRRKKKKNKKKKKSLLEKRPKRKSKMFQRGRAKKKMEDDGTHEDEDDDSVSDENMVKYSGWISVQWADEEEEDGNVAARLGSGSDEDAGPWTEPIPLGVYRISFGAGLPLRETPERDSAVLDKLERGRCVEVVETTVKGDRVRARCLVPPLSQEGDDQPGKKPARFQSGWISLLNALTGASGASPVPLGAYVAVAEGGCVITEGGRLDSKEKGTLNPGSCIEVVATRIEEGTVRGLIAAGGHVTLFVLNGVSTNRLAAMGGTKNPDGGRMFAMPVPLGTYQVVQNGLSVTTGLSMNSPVSMKLKVNACAEIAETRVEGGRVRGRLTAVGYGGVAKEVSGWMSLFEPTQRWAKIVCFKGGRPISPHQQQEQAQAQA
mmetsp:Transcript_9045/g.18123  ORF Transcript_9045/g.18123 Transcript_9045/m.18123 type:complete len:950 (-) Transcript_9045:85-2934(-)